MGSAGDDGPSEPSSPQAATLSKHRHPLTEWLLLEGNRVTIAFAAAVVLFLGILGLFALGVLAFENGGAVTRMASGMIAGTFSLVTLVVSVNQLILSQEFSPAAEYRDRLQGVLEYRRDVEDATRVPAAPAEPARLLELLAAAIHHRAEVLAETVAEHEDAAARTRIEEYATGVATRTDTLEERFEQGGVTAFDALLLSVEFENAWHLHAARHLRNDTSRLSSDAVQAFDDLIQVLRLFKAGQEHFKTIYLQRELTQFSRITIYSGIPAVLAAVLITLLYGDVSGATISARYIPYVVSFLSTVVFLPLLLLGSYILRTATITRRTAEIGPMRVGNELDTGSFEVSYERRE